MPMSLPLDVLCVGMAAYDLIFSVPQHPDPDEKLSATALLECGGGPAANAAIAVARLGLNAAFAGYLGHDLYGQAHLEELRFAGVDTQWVTQGDTPTALASIFVKPDGLRSVVNHRGTQPALQWQQPTLPIGLKAILFDGHEWQAALTMLKLAKEAGIPTILDAGSVHVGTEALWNQIDFLVAAETFALPFTGEKTPTNALQELRPYCRNVIITSGARGLVYYCDGETGSMPAFPVEVVDSTGAGDAFHGGFATAVAEGKPIHESLKFATAVAALSCTGLGARPSLPTRSAVEEFLKGRK